MFCGLAEEGDVEQVGFIGTDERGLRLGNERRNECLFDGVGVDGVVDLGEGPLELPTEFETVVFVVLEALEFLDEVEFEFGEIHEANSNAMSRCAKVPPYRPDFEVIPIAEVVSIQRCGERTK